MGSNAKSDNQDAAGGATLLWLSALGVVFGDIGTSPLYTFKTVLSLTGATPEPSTILGCLSLILWTLIIITSVKYVCFAMRVDNDGEGGILALMTLLGAKGKARPSVFILGLLGAALIYGDGAITPAISVLSALEGVKTAAPAFGPYVLAGTVGILIALFLFQPRGTASIGTVFGPVMALWFIVIALLGIRGIVLHPAVLFALNPFYAAHYLAIAGANGFFVLGGVFLCVTGAEALYADMGHFGRQPIRAAWFAVVFPSLLLNYAGQAALVLSGAPPSDNTFYQLCPSFLLVPMIVLATLATIIASQAVITGAFSMTRQAMQLGWLPRMRIVQTSAKGYGQIYVGAVNWLLMLVTLGLTLAFKRSDSLASAYGVAVSATMLATSFLLFIAMREIWGWSALRAGIVASGFVLVDACFFASNLTKFFDGGYVPVMLAALIYGAMRIWHKGAKVVAAKLETMPIERFMAAVESGNIPRVPGTAVFLTRTKSGAPPVMVWHLTHNRALHERLLVVTIDMQPTPWIHTGERVTLERIAPDFWRAVARYGFMERPDIPIVLQQAHRKGCQIDLSDVTYYVGHETVIASPDHKDMPLWTEGIFAFMARNSVHVSDYFRLPHEKVVEIGRQIMI